MSDRRSEGIFFIGSIAKSLYIDSLHGMEMYAR